MLHIAPHAQKTRCLFARLRLSYAREKGPLGLLAPLVSSSNRCQANDSSILFVERRGVARYSKLEVHAGTPAVDARSNESLRSIILGFSQRQKKRRNLKRRTEPADPPQDIVDSVVQ